MTAPWNYVVGSDTPSAETPIPNVETPEGRALGSHLARFADAEVAKIEERGEPVPARCGECAFRRGTLANGSVATTMNALKSCLEHEPFYCHLNVDGSGDPTRLCGGWEILAGGDRG